jgi:hypoxanthine phosphoribosyltransferase
LNAPLDIHDLNWSDFESAARTIAMHFYKLGKVTHVWGPARGGLVLAVKLSHLLNVPYEPHLNVCPRHGTLVVDDILDSGATMADYKTYPHRAVWVTKKPDPTIFHVLHLTAPAWMVFPWENLKRAQQDRDEYLGRPAPVPPVDLKPAAER